MLVLEWNPREFGDGVPGGRSEGCSPRLQLHLLHR